MSDADCNHHGGGTAQSHSQFRAWNSKPVPAGPESAFHLAEGGQAQDQGGAGQGPQQRGALRAGLDGVERPQRPADGLSNYFMALRQAELLTTETRLHSQQVQLLSARFKVGYVARTDVVGARQSLLSSRVALRRAEGRVPETRAALAAAIGIPVSALQGIKFSWTAFDHQPLPAVQNVAPIPSKAVVTADNNEYRSEILTPGCMAPLKRAILPLPRGRWYGSSARPRHHIRRSFRPRDFRFERSAE
jgi:hypothetical protein